MVGRWATPGEGRGPNSRMGAEVGVGGIGNTPVYGWVAHWPLCCFSGPAPVSHGTKNPGGARQLRPRRTPRAAWRFTAPRWRLR
jgi:hypothetical protein